MITSMTIRCASRLADLVWQRRYCAPRSGLTCRRLSDRGKTALRQVKQVSLNPLAKHAKMKSKGSEEQLETRQLETALDKICRCTEFAFGQDVPPSWTLMVIMQTWPHVAR